MYYQSPKKAAKPIMCGPRIAIAIVRVFSTPNTLRAKPPFVVFSEEEEKETLPETHKTFEVTAAQTSGLVNLVLSRQTGFFECEQRFNRPILHQNVNVS